MFYKIKNKKLIVNYLDEYIEFPEDIKEKINNKWNDIIKENPTLWDGDICCVYDFKVNENSIEIICKKSKFSHLLYQERVGLPREYECRNLCAGPLLETSDGYFVLAELDVNTSYPYVLQIPGGNIDKNDIFNGEIDCLNTIIRETKEEINIDLNDKTFVKEYEINGLNYVDEGLQPGVQVFAIAKLNMAKDELELFFTDYYKWLINNNGEREIKKLHFLNKNNCLIELENINNPKRNYLKPLLENNIYNINE